MPRSQLCSISSGINVAFKGIQRSPRHKLGIAVRFPRILRWRHDKPREEADTLEAIRSMLPPLG